MKMHIPGPRGVAISAFSTEDEARDLHFYLAAQAFLIPDPKEAIFTSPSCPLILQPLGQCQTHDECLVTMCPLK